MEISKELLSEVLGINNISSIIYDIDFPNIIEYSQYATLARGRRSTEINIYELAFKLKIWAYSNCCELVSYTEGCEIFQTQLGETIKYFYAETEVEAIIKACEWVLKEINGNK